MELTTKQIAEINRYLTIKKIDHIDIKLEVLDHIITDVEYLMSSKDIDFEFAFKEVRLKWKQHFTQTSSFYFGVAYSAPKIILDNAKRAFKKSYFILIASYFLPFILFLNFQMKVTGEARNLINGAISIATIAFVILFIYTYYQKSKIKLKTTYSFILKTQFWSFLFLIFPLFGKELIDKNNEFNSVYLGLIFAFICSLLTTRYFYKKHVSVISKYKNV